MTTMARAKRRAHPGRPFVLALLALCTLALLSHVRETTAARSLRSTLQPLLPKRDFTALADDTKAPQCRDVHHHKDQCAFIRANCEDEEAGLFSYLSLYFCNLGHAKPIAFIIIALWTALLFSTIGIAASDFFCINLSTISHILGMSESMAGVTFLAFGNGSPDVFSTFAAIKSNSGSLAVGELIGAASFITAVVSGSMALVRPFKVAARSFVRDVGFFIVSVAFSMVFLANGALTIVECGVMVAFYVFYVLFVCVWHWWLSRRRRRREREAAIRGHYVEPIDPEDEYHDDDDRSSRRSYARPISVHDINELERIDYDGVDDYADLDDDETRDKWMGELSSNMRITKAPDGERKIPFTPIRPSLVGALEFRAVLASLQKSRNIQTLPINMRRYSDAPYYTTAQQHDAPSAATHPEGAQNAVDASLQEQDPAPAAASSRPTAHVRTGSRNRAVSTNDAGGFQTGPISGGHTSRASNFDLLGSSPPTADRPQSAQGALPTEEDTTLTHNSSGSPFFSISPALDETTAEASNVEPPPRAKTQDFLAPPGHDRSADGSPDRISPTSQPRPQRPNLRIPIPHTSDSPNQTPSHSPWLVAQSARNISRTQSFMLPPPSTEIDSLLSKDDPPKRIWWWPYRVLPSPQIITRTLFPTLYGWRSKTYWDLLLGVVTAPSFFLLTITLPVVEPSSGGDDAEKSLIKDVLRTPNSSYARAPPHPHSSHPSNSAAPRAISDSAPVSSPVALPEDHTSVPTSTDKEWNRWLVDVQCFTAPLLIVFVVWANTGGTWRGLVLPVLYSLLGSLVALLFLHITTKPTRPPRWHFILCFVGFAVSVTWISTIANEVVGVLKCIGVIFNISDAILGLTIFAVGNSLGDLVADITVARLGFPVMALSACFGGPMLNILLGIGLSGLYMTVHHAEKRQRKHPGEPIKFKPFHVDVSGTLLVSAVVLLITLVGLLIVVPLNKWRMDKRIGWGLIILWVIGTVGNVVVEVTGVIGS